VFFYEDSNPQNLYNRALVKQKLGNYEGSNEDFTEAYNQFKANESSNKYSTRFNMGINYRKLGKYLESVEEFKKAIEIHADKASVYNNLGLTYFEKADYDEAISNFSKAIRVEPQAAFYSNRALASYN